MIKVEKRLKELIVYIASKCAHDDKYGATKLNKILFFSDFLYYLKRFKPITGHPYVHMPYGPGPDDIKEILREMTGKDIAYAISECGPFRQKRIVALREPDLSIFDPDMISHVDSVIETLSTKNSLTATQLSDFTHAIIGWLVTSDGETIPYQTVFIKDKKYQVATDWERIKSGEIASELAGQYGYPNS